MEETRDIIFTINNKYTSMESVHRHEDFAEKTSILMSLLKVVRKYGKFLSFSDTTFHFIG